MIDNPVDKFTLDLFKEVKSHELTIADDHFLSSECFEYLKKHKALQQCKSIKGLMNKIKKEKSIIQKELTEELN